MNVSSSAFSTSSPVDEQTGDANLLQVEDGFYAFRFPEHGSIWNFIKEEEHEVSTEVIDGLIKGLLADTDPPIKMSAYLKKCPLSEIQDPYLMERLANLSPSSHHELLDEAVKAHASNKTYCFNYYQMPAQPITVCRRADLIAETLKGGKALFIGDDDLVSVCLSHMGCDASVGEIDELLLRLIPALNSKVQCERLDVFEGLAHNMREKFDVVFMDPMSTFQGVSAFIQVALQALAPGGRVFVCGHERLQIVFDFLVDELDVTLRAHHRDFNTYYSPRSITPLEDRKDIYELSRK